MAGCRRWWRRGASLRRPASGDGDGQLALRAKFRNGLRLVDKENEALFMRQADAVRQSVTRITA